MAENQFDLIVIGAGPGGYVAAIRAAQLGMKVACVDRAYFGGTCLNVGCIPSKAWLESSWKYHEARTELAEHGVSVGEVKLDMARMLTRKNQVVQQLTRGIGGLFKKNKVEGIIGQATITAPDAVTVLGGAEPRTLRGKRILIASGSVPADLPQLPFDGKYIVSSTEALDFDRPPGKLVVIGAGAIGLELGSVWQRLGSEVLIVEFLDRIMPMMDREMTGHLHKALVRQGLQFRLSTSAKGARVVDEKVHVLLAAGDKDEEIVCDRLLVAVGRKPFTQDLGVRRLGVELDRKGYIKVDARFATSVPGIFAIGDVIGGAMLAHKAEEEGVACVELMAGQPGHVNYNACPNVVYTHPELASVGLTEDEARQRGEVRVGRFPFSANGRARTMNSTEGMVKIIADAGTDRLVGGHILGAHAGELIAELAVAMEMGASVEDVARSFHAHPTMPEAIKEAALAADGRAVHY